MHCLVLLTDRPIRFIKYKEVGVVEWKKTTYTKPKHHAIRTSDVPLTSFLCCLFAPLPLRSDTNHRLNNQLIKQADSRHILVFVLPLTMTYLTFQEPVFQEWWCRYIHWVNLQCAHDSLSCSHLILTRLMWLLKGLTILDNVTQTEDVDGGQLYW